MIHLPPEELALVKKILAVYVPDRRVVVFGSRATGGRLKPHSDLDLCIMGDAPVDSETIGDLRNTFSASRLPIRVDILDWASASPILRENITQQAQDIT